MFKFLKKKLKKFEDQLEAELEVELDKEVKPEPEEPKPEPTPAPPKPVVEEKPVEKPPMKEVPKPVEEKPKEIPKPVEPIKKEIPEEKPEEIDKKIDQLIKKVEKPDEKERKARIERDRRKRQEEIDKQIEKSIETELEHTLRAKRSIQEVVKEEKKLTRGISEEKLDDLLWELEVGLLESDVAYTVIESIKKDIKEELRNISFEKGKVGEIVEKVLKNAISHVLKSNEIDFNEFIEKNEKPVVIMFVGVNGSGKTLAIAKIATMLKKMGKSCVMAAGDTFRAGAIEQLSIHAEKVGVKIIK
ncbi:MAG: signal recognition particle receptor subunit alpha, partial [Candidatus Thermoplasmatota archaeon]|nr:signal recognition particle receptor subunit alpha [Candidatus Thermoplasmatota archaeon]